MANQFRDPRYDQFPGDGPSIGRAGYIPDVASKMTAGDGTFLVTDREEKYLLFLIRALDIDRGVATRLLVKQFNSK